VHSLHRRYKVRNTDVLRYLFHEPELRPLPHRRNCRKRQITILAG
jgi:hypothetical protein